MIGLEGVVERLTPRKIKALLGKEIDLSEWKAISQDRINAFAECTEDRQWIHVDEELARRGPLGGTVAHGLLILSLLPEILQKIPLFRLKYRWVVNYGANRIRFINPVRSGSRIRNRAVLKAMERKGFRRILLTIENTVEIEGENKPALVAELLAMVFL
jgi:acyl dehydratase